MRYAVKNKKSVITAYQLGAGTDMEKQLLSEGCLVHREDGSYELFSQEAVNGSGEIAVSGDYFKVDTVNGKHYPYPNKRKWFEKNYIPIDGEKYLSLSKPRMIWESTDPISEEIQYLLDNGQLQINVENEQHYFNAFLFGAELSAAKDAVVVLYHVERDELGTISDILFNFVARDDFMRNYSYCSSGG